MTDRDLRENCVARIIRENPTPDTEAALATMLNQAFTLGQMAGTLKTMGLAGIPSISPQIIEAIKLLSRADIAGAVSQLQIIDLGNLLDP